MEDTPLYSWFKPSLSEGNKLLVNSYHHQGVKRLAARFQPMAFAPDGLIEAFYDPNCFNPTDGRFIMGLQFHPERMRHFQDGNFDSQTESKEIFDYPECPLVYQVSRNLHCIWFIQIYNVVLFSIGLCHSSGCISEENLGSLPALNHSKYVNRVIG